MLNKLIALQEEIYSHELTNLDTGEPKSWDFDWVPRLSFFKAGEHYALSYFGSGFDEDPSTPAVDFDFETNFAFCRVLDFIAEPEHAEHLISLDFSGHDEGANGTKSWVFDRLANSDVMFPNLLSFSVQLTDPADHNFCLIDSNDFSMRERSIVARLLQKMPRLQSLAIPSAPDPAFFAIGEHPLQYLTIQAGANHQNFIEHWAESSNFPQLAVVDYAEVLNVADPPELVNTPFEHFRKLFASKAFSSVQHFKLRNSILSREQLFELQRINPEVQFLHVPSGMGRYVSHLMAEERQAIRR